MRLLAILISAILHLLSAHGSPSSPPIGVSLLFFKGDSCTNDDEFVYRQDLWWSEYPPPFGGGWSTCVRNYNSSSVMMFEYPRLTSDGERKNVCSVQLYTEHPCMQPSIMLNMTGGAGEYGNCWGEATGFEYKSYEVMCFFDYQRGPP